MTHYSLVILGGSAIGVLLAAIALWVSTEAFDGRLASW